jgi:drug/metabolite transporter (DMT)-like permease
MNHFEMDRKKAIILLLTAAALWSTSGLFIKLIDWKPLSILGGRTFVVFFVFLIYMRRLNLRLSPMKVAGAFSYVSVQLFFIIATKLTAAANAVFLHYTGPLYVLLFGYWFLGERPSRADWISMPLIFIGLLLFLGDGFRSGGIEGNIFGVLSGMSLAAMLLCLRREKSHDPEDFILLGCLIGIVIGFPSMIKETFTIQSVGIILFMGIIQMGIAYIFFTMAIKQLDALETSLIIFVEPIFNPVWVFLVIGEIPGSLALVGGVLVIGTAVARAIISARPVVGRVED